MAPRQLVQRVALVAFPEAEQTDLRPEEPHLRLRHGLHHKRHADRGQPDPPERHGVAASPAAAFLAPAHVLAPRAASSSTKKADTDGADAARCSEEPKVAAQPVLLQTHFIPLAGTQKGCVFNALRVLFPNAINSQEFRMIASTACRNSKEKLSFSSRNSHGHPGWRCKGARERRNTQSPPHPVLSAQGSTGDSLPPPPQGNPQCQEADF
ncbi:uncharacterized protein [Physeter macrocephalus]|uniref:Uncharacterized protein n=1 Tax=Physeter macrocephalus TaxID=9755 RepID=A0A9W2X2W1_PHYMC|nr:uncharacterized protein LOC129392713 [Physeter catodon]